MFTWDTRYRLKHFCRSKYIKDLYSNQWLDINWIWCPLQSLLRYGYAPKKHNYYDQCRLLFIKFITSSSLKGWILLLFSFRHIADWWYTSGREYERLRELVLVEWKYTESNFKPCVVWAMYTKYRDQKYWGSLDYLLSLHSSIWSGDAPKKIWLI